jgi:energy-coupling factor transporter ATP-binding protein EcfA2
MSTATIPLIMPYPGLRPFEETDHALFFGREAQVSALLRQLEDHAFVAVLGSSGSGKSSLVRAGLIPAVREGFLLAMTKWRFLVIRPGHRPYQRLVRVLTSPIDSSGENHSAPARDEPTTSEESRVLSTLLGNDRGLLTALDESGISADTNVMIVVDQFEELFAFRRAGAGRDDVASRDEVAAFVNTLLCACADPNGRVRVVLTMRSDFVGDCEAFLGLPEAVSRSQFLVPRLDRVQMEDAILRPGTIKEAGFSPFSFEQGLVNRIINDAGDRPDQLPLMQHALMRTWKLAVRRAKQNGTLVQLMHKDYDDAGGITEALSRHAEDAWKLIEGDQRKEEIVRRLFLLLCDISPDGQITRRRPRVTEVQAVTGAGKEELEGLIRLFQEDDRNFLFPRLEHHQNARDFLDISHEALLRQWPRFARWLEQERQDASELERLAEQAVLHSQNAGGLLSATDLVRIAEWNRRVSVEWARRYVKLEAWGNVVAYIEESKKDIKKQAWKKRWLLAAIGIVLVVATAISLVLMFQANAAKADAQHALTQANSAKAAAQRALTDSFFRTIGTIESSVSLSSDERAALWDLAELASENVQVRETVIDRWFQTEGAVRRGLNNDTRGLRAASGLSVELRRRIMLRSKELADRLVTALENPQQTDASSLWSLSAAVAAPAARMEPQEAARLAARNAQVLVTALENTQETSVLQSLGMSLGNLVKFLPSAQERATLLLALSHIFLEKVPAAPQQGQEEAQEEAKVRKEVTELCQLLSPQELAEMLKWPFTVGEAEKIVLTELEHQTGRTFGGDVWKFVEQAQSLGITGLDAPAKRPRIEDK